MDPDADVVAEAIEIVAIDEVARGMAAHAATGSPMLPFTPDELAFAHSVSDPARRLAARWAAKRAAARVLGGDVTTADVEVARQPGGAPMLRFGPLAAARLRALGAARALVSLTHGRTHAAAAVILVRGGV